MRSKPHSPLIILSTVQKSKNRQSRELTCRHQIHMKAWCTYIAGPLKRDLLCKAYMHVICLDWKTLSNWSRWRSGWLSFKRADPQYPEHAYKIFSWLVRGLVHEAEQLYGRNNSMGGTTLWVEEVLNTPTLTMIDMLCWCWSRKDEATSKALLL